MLEMLHDLALELDANGILVPTHIEAQLNEEGLFINDMNEETEHG